VKGTPGDVRCTKQIIGGVSLDVGRAVQTKDMPRPGCIALAPAADFKTSSQGRGSTHWLGVSRRVGGNNRGPLLGYGGSRCAWGQQENRRRVRGASKGYHTPSCSAATVLFVRDATVSFTRNEVHGDWQATADLSQKMKTRVDRPIIPMRYDALQAITPFANELAKKPRICSSTGSHGRSRSICHFSSHGPIERPMAPTRMTHHPAPDNPKTPTRKMTT
jgi:hypothetical protein